MKTHFLKYPILVFIFCFLLIHSSFSQYYYTQRQITRGADTAEIYLFIKWYAGPDNVIWCGLFHSNDNGQTLSVQRKGNSLVEGSPIFGDSIAGAIFEAPFHLDTFAISYNYGVTFEKKYFSNIYEKAAGCMAGEIYIHAFGLYRGTDYGNNFTLQSNNDSLRLHDVGTLPGEVFMIKNAAGVINPIKLAYSSDYGQTFSIRQVFFPGMPSQLIECDVHRGTTPGELYFIVWKNLDTIGLYHSNDYGQTLTFQSYMLKMTQHFDEIFYTPGRTPGSFYYARRVNCGGGSLGDHSCLWIDFSRDYGVTFTTYYHELDSLYTGKNETEPPINIRVYPNPATTQLNINLSPNIQFQNLQLLNFLGQVCIERKINSGSDKILLDIENLEKGIYLLKVKSTDNRVANKKIIVN